jgi:hypothetical protein
MCKQVMADGNWFKSGVKKRSCDAWAADRLSQSETNDKNISDLKNNY